MDIEEIKKNKPLKELMDFCIINVDKDSGMTSFKVCEEIANIFQSKKVGHFGTLDPNVSGVLPIALNRACRLTEYFLDKDKEYIGKMKLHADISEENLKKEMEKFVGKIIQKPPVKSNVKRVFRERNVKSFILLKKDNREVEFSSDVQAGTYIRKLVSDLGEKIGGAHMTQLRRVRAGIFLEPVSHRLTEIKEASKKYKAGDESLLRKILIPGEIIERVLTIVEVKEESVRELMNGKPLMKKDIKSTFANVENKITNDFEVNSEIFSVFCKEKFIGIYKKSKSEQIIAKPEFVLN